MKQIYVVITEYEGEFIAAFTDEYEAETVASTSKGWFVERTNLYSSFEEYREWISWR
jgi:hypothetical protein